MVLLKMEGRKEIFYLTTHSTHFIYGYMASVVENSLRILDLCRTPETDSTNPWGSIEPRLRTTTLVGMLSPIVIKQLVIKDNNDVDDDDDGNVVKLKCF